MTLAALLAASAALAQEAGFAGLGDLPGGAVRSFAEAVSADGSVVVGLSESADSAPVFLEAFRWESGIMEGLGDLPDGLDEVISGATDVSADGAVVVGVGETSEGAEAFRWEGGEMVGLGVLGGGEFFQSQAEGISADGSVIVGWSSSANGGSEAFRWVEGEMEGLGDLPGGQFLSAAYDISLDGSVIVGAGSTEEGVIAFRLAGEEMEDLGDLPGGDALSLAWAVSFDGSVVVGESSSANGILEAFRWKDGEMESLGDLPGGEFFSSARDVSADGTVVGVGVSGNGSEAFIWTEADGMRSLREVLEIEYELDLMGWLLASAAGISDDGTVIVGTGINPDGDFEAWRVVLPDLATTPNPLDFGPVMVGQARGPLSVSITNATFENVTVSEISKPEAPFTAEGGTCDPVPFTLAPDESCELTFSFSPAVAGIFEDMVTLTSDAPSSPHVIMLAGAGSEESLHITPDPLVFGEVITGEVGGPSSVTLSNADGTVAIDVSAVGTPTAPFSAAGGTCGSAPFNLEPFASCTLDYIFSPTEGGSFSDVIEVTSDAPSGPGGFALSGEGLLREMTVAPILLDFSDVPVGEAAGPLSVTLTNTGDVDVTLSQVPDPDAPFELTEDTCEAVLPSDSNCTLGYIFSPTTPGDFSADVTIVSNALSSPHTVTLQGTGLGATIDVDPDALAATLEAGQMGAQPLEIANLGNEPLEWTVTEDPAAKGQLLWPVGSVTLPVTISPSGAVAGFALATGTQGAAVAPYPFSPSGTEATTITHSESLDIQAENTIACVNNSDGSTVENHFLRTFTLTDFGFLGAFDVTEVTFGINTLSDTAPITVNLYTLEGEFTFDNLTLIGTATEELEAQDLTLVTVPVTGTAPADSTLVVEIEAPDLSGVAVFFPGANNLGETAPSYIAASACGIDEPTTMADVGLPNVHLVMTVTGTAEEIDCALPTWADVEPLSGSVPGGETRVADITFDAMGLDGGEFEANLCLSSNDPNRPLTVVPLTLTVTGGGGGAELTFDPQSLNFGNVEVGTTSVPQTATLQNTGDVDATGITFTLPGSGFDADTSDCGDTLPAGEGCPVSVTFTPAEPGPVEASLNASSAEGASAELPLSGTGLGDGGFAPVNLEVDPEPFLADGNGVFEPGELVEVAPAWRNDSLTIEPLTGTAANFNGTDGAVYFLAQEDADYGNLKPGATSGCRDTGICYWLAVDDPAIRPATHWEASFEETVADDTTHTWGLHIGDSFTDAPRSSPFYTAVETLLHHGVTGGCTDTEYCASGTNTRGQMAVFLLKAAESGDFVPSACIEGEERFFDVPFDSPLCPWIEELAARQVTTGCGGDNYCPGAPVTRAQMAIFLLKAFEDEGYTPPECTGTFTDVTCPSQFAAWVEELATRGITGGCAGDPPAYCPATPVTRAQMAVFVTKTFGLTLYGP